jgi:hypothetical protein
MTRHLPYRYIQRLWRLKSAACIRPAVLEQDWHVNLLVAAILCVATLPACKAQSIHPKAIPYTPAAGAEKIDINLLRLDADVRGGSKRLDTAAAVMGMETVSGRLRLDLITQSWIAARSAKFNFQASQCITLRCSTNASPSPSRT